MPSAHMDRLNDGFRILLVEDCVSFRDAVALLLRMVNDVDGVGTVAEARAALEKNPYDVVVLDRFLPDGDGLDLIAEIKRDCTNTAVIVVTSDAEFNTVKRCIRAGADDFVQKSGNVGASLLTRIPFAVARLASDRKLSALDARAKKVVSHQMVGHSGAIMGVRNDILTLAGSNPHVLITGESGTGKELAAQAVHEVGTPRGEKLPFVAINCNEIQENLARSALFGHERGSFTGAIDAKPGLFEDAHGGTLFFDEIGDLKLDVQGMILRAVQEGQIQRVGGRKPIKTSVRIIGATNRDLEEMVKRGEFREDLYYRLSVVRIQLPALRTRKDDISDLAQVFVLEFAGPNVKISDATLKLLQTHDWPGNIRELKNTIERAVILMRQRKATQIEREDIVLNKPLSGPAAVVRRMEMALPHSLAEVNKKAMDEFLLLAEKEYLRCAMELGGGDTDDVAGRLELGRSTLFRRLMKHELPRRSYGVRRPHGQLLSNANNSNEADLRAN